MFIECLQKWSTVAGHVTGLGTSASQWLSYVLVTLPLLAAYLHRIGWRDSASCHTVMEPKKTANIRSYTVQRMTRRSGSHGPIFTTKRSETPGAFLRGSGQWPIPRPGMRERERGGPSLSYIAEWNWQHQYRQNSKKTRVNINEILQLTPSHHCVCVTLYVSVVMKLESLYGQNDTDNHGDECHVACTNEEKPRKHNRHQSNMFKMLLFVCPESRFNKILSKILILVWILSKWGQLFNIVTDRNLLISKRLCNLALHCSTVMNMTYTVTDMFIVYYVN